MNMNNHDYLNKGKWYEGKLADTKCIFCGVICFGIPGALQACEDCAHFGESRHKHSSYVWPSYFRYNPKSKIDWRMHMLGEWSVMKPLSLNTISQIMNDWVIKRDRPIEYSMACEIWDTRGQIEILQQKIKDMKEEIANLECRVDLGKDALGVAVEFIQKKINSL